MVNSQLTMINEGGSIAPVFMPGESENPETGKRRTFSEFYDNSVTLSFPFFCILWQVSSVRLQPGINSGEPVMRTSVWAIVLLLAALLLVQANASAQERHILIVSPKVGSVIDSVERSTYNLFPGMQNFYSATFYQTPDSAIHVSFKRVAGTIALPESTHTTSYFTLKQVAEWIEHRDEIAHGTYELGSSQPLILYEDGTSFKPPTPPQKTTVTAEIKRPANELPLAKNSGRLSRPSFSTTHCTVAAGVAFNDFSGLVPLGIDRSKATFPVTVSFEIPLFSDPEISFAGGGTLFPQQGLSSVAMYVFLRPSSSWMFAPIVGLGGGRAYFTKEGYSAANGSVNVHAEQPYLAIAVGMNLVPNWLDALLTLPLANKLQTTFENASYSAGVTGPQFNLVFYLW